jgi:hypothetical protein
MMGGGNQAMDSEFGSVYLCELSLGSSLERFNYILQTLDFKRIG